MERIAEIGTWAWSNKVDLIQTFFVVLGAASAIAKLTPTKSDDKVIDKIFKLVHLVGLTKKEAFPPKEK